MMWRSEAGGCVGGSRGAGWMCSRWRRTWRRSTPRWTRSSRASMTRSGSCRPPAPAGPSRTRSVTWPTSTAPRWWRSRTRTGSPTLRDELFAAALGEAGAADELTLAGARAMAPGELLVHWRDGRTQLLAAAEGLRDDSRVVWYGPSMSARSFLTARLMETWAHGQDVVDAVGAHRPATDRLFHVAQMGVITRGWSYLNRGEEPPAIRRPGRAALARRDRADLGGRGRCPVGHRSARRLLPGRDPTPTRRRDPAGGGGGGRPGLDAAGAGLRRTAHRRTRRLNKLHTGTARADGTLG